MVPPAHPNTYATIHLQTSQTSSPIFYSPMISFPTNLSPPTKELLNEPGRETKLEDKITPWEVSVVLTSPSRIPIPQKMGYSYVPHYSTAPKNISSKVCQENILPTSCGNKDPPREPPSSLKINGDLFLSEDGTPGHQQSPHMEGSYGQRIQISYLQEHWNSSSSTWDKQENWGNVVSGKKAK
ncbi:hypothetical protein O181_066882 [Austropuccinia psidii MF-1]|uniref:Uncharacterized protein n=1 Tax=Austropuccinia psidii MF-1 TaxID=1389203 RepID=A0A9Q3EWA1_9BASI|nr:hypothetical protein [Austropuccinia psidii MF-1]